METIVIQTSEVLLLPRWQDSGPQHRQRLWRASHAYARVEQHDWLRPLRRDWIARLEDVMLQMHSPALLVAYGLGCQLVQQARQFASACGADFIDCGAAGHINAESGLGAWPQGHAMLLALRAETAPSSRFGAARHTV